MPLQTRSLDEFVESFEREYQARGAADLRSFLPPVDDPLHRPVLRELIRIDLEFGWESNRPRSLEEYRSDFPALFDDPDSLQEIAYEEYRLRRRAGQAPNPQEYARRYGVRTDGWPAPPAEADADEGSVCLESVARTYRAFCLAPVVPSDRIADPHEAASVNLESWHPPAGTEGELIRLFRDLHVGDQRVAGQFADAVCTFPSAGENFLDFHLISELGRGAFGRVFLARQSALAGRPVALKLAPDVGSESQTLAQLQHTHIVPVYSVHRSGCLQAVCMPYCGAVTLADVVREFHSRPQRPRKGLELLDLLPIKPRPNGVAAPEGPSPAVRDELAGLRYSDAVLWLGARLAAGLHHAHERGILHRDVKPANVLVTDEGLPMLLDFNVAEDLKQRGASAALVGGTLPYMAPELLTAFQGEARAVDARIDVWSLGIVLFELLAGRFPFAPVRFPAGAANANANDAGLEKVLSQMQADRLAGPPCPRQFDPTISPATAAIIRRCLEPDPEQRYPSARALQEDIERQLANQPLRHTSEPSLKERAAKWLRRHPRFWVKFSAVGAAVVMFMAVILTVKAVANERTHNARKEYAAFLSESRDAEWLLAVPSTYADQYTNGVDLSRKALARYGVLTDDRWQQHPAISSLPLEERETVLSQVAELLLLHALVISDNSGDNSGDQLAEALLCNQRAKECFSAGTEPRVIRTQRDWLLDRDKKGSEELTSSERVLPLNVESDDNLTILYHARVLTAKERFLDALHLLEPAVLRKPDDFMAWHLLGYCYSWLGQHREVVKCCTACIVLKPDFYGPYFNRGLSYKELREYSAAKSDFDEAISLKQDRAEIYFDRANTREQMNDLIGAEEDLTTALVTTALVKGFSSTRIYFSRSRIRKALGTKFLANVAALWATGVQNQAATPWIPALHSACLLTKDGELKLKGAQQDHDEGMRREPTNESSWIARSYARMYQEPDKALADLDKALELNPRSRIALMNKAEILANIQNKQAEARRVLEEVLKLSPDHVEAMAGLAVILARLDQPELARERIAEALLRDTNGFVRYAAGCVYALTSRKHSADADTACKHLREALLVNHYGADIIYRDPDLAPLKGKPAYKQLLQLAGLMR